MARFGSGDTAPELATRRLLHRLGLRFRVHRRDLPGTPDIVLPRHRTVIFVHGCFWHRHQGCSSARFPKTRQDFWSAKFTANEARDARRTIELQNLGWRVLVVWECETKAPDALRDRFTREFALASGSNKPAVTGRREPDQMRG